jgi:hypothetical protein
MTFRYLVCFRACGNEFNLVKKSLSSAVTWLVPVIRTELSRRTAGCGGSGRCIPYPHQEPSTTLSMAGTNLLFNMIYEVRLRLQTISQPGVSKGHDTFIRASDN